MASRVLKRRMNTKRKRPVSGLVYVVAILAIMLVIGATSAYAMAQSWLIDLPDYQSDSSFEVSEKTRVYAADGTTLLAEFYLEDRDLVTAEQISDYVFDATVATEDERFYEHKGIDPLGIMRAITVNLIGVGHEGASTITQQLVRNTVLASEAGENTIKRKVREAYIATKLEESSSKDEILLSYLNTINYGSGAYGIEAAARKYYSKSAADLTLLEAATLVGIPQSPTLNNPIDNPDNCLTRRNLVLERMRSNGYIDQASYDALVVEPLTLNVAPEESPGGIYAYPYFTSYVRQVLLEHYTTDEVYRGGMTVYTTLDVNLQNLAETAARTKEAYIDYDLEVAMVVIDPHNGYLKAVVGGKDYYVDAFNLATQAKRQAGSSFKTFTLVGTIENGMDPNTTSVNCSSEVKIGDWEVENIDGINYGTESVAAAFELSSNTGFARLATWLTPAKVAQTATRMGIETELDPVPSITLGSIGVSPLEMAEAYATIANGGTHHETVCIDHIDNLKGETIYQSDTSGERVLTPEVSFAATKVMEGVITNGTGTEAAIANGQPAAGKTGTSENYRDSWFVGFTPQYSVAVWLGARYERSISSYYTAASVFGDFMSGALMGAPIEQFPTAGNPPYHSVTDEALGIGYWAGGSTSARQGANQNASQSASAANGGGDTAGGSGGGGSGVANGSYGAGDSNADASSNGGYAGDGANSTPQPVVPEIDDSSGDAASRPDTSGNGGSSTPDAGTTTPDPGAGGESSGGGGNITPAPSSSP